MGRDPERHAPGQRADAAAARVQPQAGAEPKAARRERQVATFVAMLSRVRDEHRHGNAAWAGRVAGLRRPGQLERVLMNLGLNARDAMPNGGTLRVRTENVSSTTSAVDDPSSLPGAYVSLEVEDTGTGIDPAVLPHIFEPFVTTKPTGSAPDSGWRRCTGSSSRPAAPFRSRARRAAAGGSLCIFPAPAIATQRTPALSRLTLDLSSAFAVCVSPVSSPSARRHGRRRSARCVALP